jgi:hypothetical protein
MVFFAACIILTLMLGDNLGNGDYLGISRSYAQGLQIVLISLAFVLFTSDGNMQRALAYSAAIVYLMCTVMLELYYRYQIAWLIKHVVSIALFFIAFRIAEKVYAEKVTGRAATIIISCYAGASVLLEIGFSGRLMLLALISAVCFYGLTNLIRLLISDSQPIALGRMRVLLALAGIALNIGLIAYSAVTFGMQGYEDGLEVMRARGKEFSV